MLDISGAAAAISGLAIIIVIIIIAVFVFPVEFSMTSSVDGGAQVEAAGGIDTELAHCLFATSNDFLEYFSKANPLGSFHSRSNTARRANLAITYAEVVCENDYRPSR